MKIHNARIVSLCPVPPGFKADGEHVLALALIELDLEWLESTPDGTRTVTETGRDILPVVAGGEEPGDIRIATGKFDGEVELPNGIDLFYLLHGFGDLISRPQVGHEADEDD